jgi:hypothetical protein
MRSALAVEIVREAGSLPSFPLRLATAAIAAAHNWAEQETTLGILGA